MPSPPPAAGVHLAGTNLRRSFKLGHRTIDVLKGVSVEVHHGECIFLVGLSGAGKSTLLYTLAGMERPEDGAVTFEGHDLYSLSDRARSRLRSERVGFIFQGYFLLPELTAMENVLLPATIRRRSAQKEAMEILERVGLADRATHLPAELSGGEQQRVAIARALVHRPAIIFADEPTGNLDAKTGAGIVDLLLEVVRERGTTMVVVTHDANLAARGDRRLEMRDGLIVE